MVMVLLLHTGWDFIEINTRRFQLTLVGGNDLRWILEETATGFFRERSFSKYFYPSELLELHGLTNELLRLS